MPARTPTLPQARSHYEAQRRITLAGLAAIRRLFKTDPRPTVPQIAATAGSYQLASATMATSTVAGWAGKRPETVAQAFVGVSSYGFSLMEPIVTTIDRHVPAPVAPVPDPWWTDAQAFMADLEQLLLSEIADAGRTASQVEFATEPDWQNYIRMLNPPSCDRCTILAGRIYRDLEAFQRHPLCDCVMVPVTNIEAAKSEGLISDPQEAFDKGLVRGLSKADAQAIRDGADMNRVVNATRGLGAPGITAALRTSLFGRTVKATTEGTTKRSAWRKANPSLLVRLRPESIYQFAEDREDAIRLLRLYGYIR